MKSRQSAAKAKVEGNDDDDLVTCRAGPVAGPWELYWLFTGQRKSRISCVQGQIGLLLLASLLAPKTCPIHSIWSQSAIHLQLHVVLPALLDCVPRMEQQRATMTAAATVLQVPELRQIILLHLPLRQLLLARRVSKDFAASIADRKVQKALWLEAASEDHIIYLPNQGARTRPRENGILPRNNAHDLSLHAKQWYKNRLEGISCNLGETIAFEAAADVPHRWPYRISKVLIPPKRAVLSNVSGAGVWTCPPLLATDKISSFAHMQVTHPPIALVTMKGDRGGEKVIKPRGGSKTIEVGGLLDEACALAQKRRAESVLVAGASRWTSIDLTVDGITGWEMLALLRGSLDYRTDQEGVYGA
ncbi:hypothetical protein LTR17_002563 [Elasticomyces elasticus]|nr:hypothetical protein LTR17_002563 [Elasticomyces elasticus]